VAEIIPVIWDKALFVQFFGTKSMAKWLRQTETGNVGKLQTIYIEFG
jgi:hypothetical protein